MKISRGRRGGSLKKADIPLFHSNSSRSSTTLDTFTIQTMTRAQQHTCASGAASASAPPDVSPTLPASPPCGSCCTSSSMGHSNWCKEPGGSGGVTCDATCHRWYYPQGRGGGVPSGTPPHQGQWGKCARFSGLRCIQVQFCDTHAHIVISACHVSVIISYADFLIDMQFSPPPLTA